MTEFRCFVKLPRLLPYTRSIVYVNMYVISPSSSVGNIVRLLLEYHAENNSRKQYIVSQSIFQDQMGACRFPDLRAGAAQ